MVPAITLRRTMIKLKGNMKSLTFLIPVYVVLFFFTQPNGSNAQVVENHHTNGADVKVLAHDVLKNKCNSCHRTRNPSKVLSLENMDALAPRIYNQVFVLQRMPKGEKRRKSMTAEELQSLKDWLGVTLEPIALETI